MSKAFTSNDKLYCGSCSTTTFRILRADISEQNILENIQVFCQGCSRNLTVWWVGSNVAPQLVTHFPGLVVIDGRVTLTSTIDTLKRILNNAHAQSMKGKGIERHGATGATFDAQQIVAFGVTTKSINYNIGQANKKILEALNLPPAKAIHELLGAINYIAGAIAIQEKLHPEVLANDSDLMKGGLYNK